MGLALVGQLTTMAIGVAHAYGVIIAQSRQINGGNIVRTQLRQKLKHKFKHHWQCWQVN